MSISPVREAAGAYQGLPAEHTENEDIRALMLQQMEMMKGFKQTQDSLRLDIARLERENKSRDQSIADLNEHLKNITSASEPKEKTTKEKVVETCRDISAIGGAAFIMLSLGSFVAAGAAAVMMAPTIKSAYDSISLASLMGPVPGGSCPSLDRINAWNDAVARYTAAAAASPADKQALIAQMFPQPQGNEEAIKQFTDFVSNL